MLLLCVVYFKFKFENKGKKIIKFNFNKLITNMNYLFFECSNLTNINLLNFNTEKIPKLRHCCNQKDFYCIFSGCLSLKGNVITTDKKIKKFLDTINK